MHLRDELNAGGYRSQCSILELPDDPGAYLSEHRTVRKRVARTVRRGYTFRSFAREERVEEIFQINSSLPERQGRPMNPAYLVAPTWCLSPLPQYVCQRHNVTTYGVFDRDDVLRAYASVYRSGELVNISTILGHGAFLRDEIMFPLVWGIVLDQHRQGGYMLYAKHNSGTAGLQQFKEWFGFRPVRVEWVA